MAIEVESGDEVFEFPDETHPDEIRGALRKRFGAPKVSTNGLQVPQDLLRPRLDSSFAAPVTAEPDPSAFSELSGIPGQVLGYAGNLARSIPADLAAGFSLLKRQEGTKVGLLPSASAIGNAVRKNLPESTEASGNLPAAVMDEPMPIDTALRDASSESTGAATLGKVGQGVAATAPLAVLGGLPSWALKLASAGFSAQMIAHAPEQFKQYAEEINKPKDEQDPDKISSLQSDIIQTSIFAPLAGAHAGGSTGAAGAAKLKTLLDRAKDTSLKDAAQQRALESTLPGGGANELQVSDNAFDRRAPGVTPEQTAIGPGEIESVPLDAATGTPISSARSTLEKADARLAQLAEQARLKKIAAEPALKEGEQNADLNANTKGDTLRNGKFDPNQNELQAGTQGVSGGTEKNERGVASPVSRPELQASDEWLKAVSENDSSAVKNAEKKLLGQPTGGEKLKELEILVGINSKGGALRAPGSYGVDIRKAASDARTRSPQKREQLGQSPGESSTGVTGGAQQNTPFSKGDVVGEISGVSDLQVNKEYARSDGVVQKLLSEAKAQKPPSADVVAKTPTDEFIEAIEDPKRKVSNDSNDPNVLTTRKYGLQVTGISDLNKLLKANDKIEEFMQFVKEKREKKEALTPDEMAKYASLAQKGQFVREVIQTATNAGSWAEENQTAKGKPIGERPLDWKKHPEVEQWLRDNEKATGIKLPEKEASPVKGTGTAPEQVPLKQGTESPVVGNVPVPPVHDWTSATADAPEAIALVESKSSSKSPQIVEYHAGVPIPKFENRKMSELDRVTTNRSAKLQKSFDEARRAQKEINRVIPNKLRQGAASVYREAGGDMAVLKDWETNAKQQWMKDLARTAQTLTPDEIAIVNKSAAAFDVLEKRGNKYDVLKAHRDNYIPHVWDVKKPGSFGLGGGMLKQRFKFSKARTFDTFFDGDQAGFKPKTTAIGDLLPTYLHEMNRTIADRQAVQELVAGKTKDGEPLAIPRGNAKVVDGDNGQAVLVAPRALKDVDTSHYKTMENQPALSNWTWAGKDTDGNPIFMKSDLAVHPDVYRRLNSILGESVFKQWYRDQTGGISQVPKAILRGADVAQSAMKREMFGFLAPFHQVQEGTHAVGHAVNPFFGIPKVDFRDAGQLDAARHGLMLLPDRTTSQHYLEGVGAQSSLISKGLRKTGKAGKAVADVIDGYQDYLFHQYIPGLKYKTYEAILDRNLKRYQPEIAKGELNESDVKILSAEQSNAAYGHLNYALLDRNPTIQHLAQITLLAPDFLEARGRFAGQAFKGLSSKVGTEQMRAIATLALAQAGSAFVISQVLGVDYDPKHPFEVVYKGRRYTMRSVPEDIFSAIKDTRQFIYSRVNPLTVKGGIQLATGLNYRGEKVSAMDTLGELLTGYIPITARSIPGLRNLTETGKNASVTPLEQLAGSLGVRVSRYSPISETYKLAGDWMDKQNMPRDKGSYPISKYQQLRYALEDGDTDRAIDAYSELKKTMKPGDIAKGFKESVTHPFTGSKASDAKFTASLKGYDKEMYNLAVRKRHQLLSNFNALKK